MLSGFAGNGWWCCTCNLKFSMSLTESEGWGAHYYVKTLTLLPIKFFGGFFRSGSRLCQGLDFVPNAGISFSRSQPDSQIDCFETEIGDFHSAPLLSNKSR